MSYTLNNLGSKNFENLVQALSKKIIGEGVSIYGIGPDGQREATFSGKAPYPSVEECWDGYWVIQAKFKDPLTKKADYPWLKECFEEEMRNFKEKKENGKPIPDNYLFFTNVVLTPMLEKGIKDKIDELANQYKDLIRNIHIIGSDDIAKFLDGHRDVATSYASYILSGDILSYLYESVQEREKERQNAFLRYIAQAFNDDYCSRMEQAGQVTEEKVSIDKVYIDLNFKFEGTENEAKFIEHSVNMGNKIHRFSTFKQQESSYINEMGISNKYVLKGSAGQGKSTVCQFLAQIYRAAFMKNFCETTNPKTDDFIDRIREDNIILPTCYRVPIRLELRLYSSWIINRQKEKKSIDLVTYISSIIAEKSAQKFDNETLRLYFKKYSWAFFFDGLDEVPESSNRKELMSEIERFIDVELRQADADAMFFATTRPEGYVGEFDKSSFIHIDLMPLDKTSCFNYLNKLLNAIEYDSTKRTGYMEILKQGLDNQQIAFMMQTPLQATIITILVRAGGEPPRDKFSLFKEYFDIILKREKQKGMGTILNSNQDLVEGVYYMLGYDLQKRSSTTEGSDALISLDRMKQLIKEKLSEDGIDENARNYNQLLNDTYSMIVHRINFASEIKEGYIGFSIRSMQEFLAAVHIVKTTEDERLRGLLKDLAVSSYWKNTFIFLVECIAKMKSYYLDTLIDTVLGELNGSDIPIEQTNGVKSIHYGSQVAFMLLSNNIFKNKPRYENKLCKYIEEYSKLELWDDIITVLTMSDNVKSQIANYIINKAELSNTDFAISSLLLQDNSVGLTLKGFSERYASEIAVQFYKLFNSSCPRSLYNVVLIAIQKGEILELSATQIIDIITNIKEINYKEAKATMFKITLKALLNHDMFDKESIDLLSKFFDCDLQILYDIREFEGEKTEVTCYLDSLYFFPVNLKADLIKIIALADEYSLDGLSLILKTIFSKKIDDYIYFYNNIDKYEDEIATLNEKTLMTKNSVMWSLWCENKYKLKRNEDTLLEKYSDYVFTFLNKPKKINCLADFVEECKNKFSLYGLTFKSTPNAFSDFYLELHALCKDIEIEKSSCLCSNLIFVYACQYRYVYLDRSSKSRESKLETLNKYIGQMLEYSGIVDEYSVWKKRLWCIAFLHMKPKDYIKNKDISFLIPDHQRYLDDYFRLKNNDCEKILKNIVNYISVTENISTFDFLEDFIITNLNYETVLKVDWSTLIDFNQPLIECLFEFSKALTVEDVYNKVLVLLSNSDLENFVFKFILNKYLPEHFLPVYIYFLNKFRAENKKDYIEQLERRIREYISNSQINI